MTAPAELSAEPLPEDTPRPTANLASPSLKRRLGGLGDRPRILVLVRGHLGDLVSALPFLRDLRAAFPASTITALVNEYLIGALEGCPYVDRVVYGFAYRERQGAARLYHGLPVSLRLVGRHDLAIALRSSTATASVVMRLSGAKVRVGYDQPGIAGRLLTHDLGPQPSGRSVRLLNLALLKAIGVPGTPHFPSIDWLPKHVGEDNDRLLAERGIKPGEPFAIFQPSCHWGCNEWTSEKWASLADHVADKRGLKVVFTGTAERFEVEKFAEIRALSRCRPIGVHGATTIPQLFDVVGRASLVVAPDSALTQIALAQRTPSVILFGIEPIAENGPLVEEGSISEIIQHWPGRALAPAPNPLCRFGQSHCHTSNCRENSSLQQTTLEEAAQRLDAILDRSNRNGSMPAGLLDRTPKPTRAPLTSDTLVGLDPFLELESDWRGLVEASQTQNPFLSWEWISAWVKHFCGDDLVTVVVRSSGRVVGVAPFYRNHYRLLPGVKATCLQLCGPREYQHLFEIREVLLAPGYETAALRALVSVLAGRREWDWVEMSAFGSGVGDWAGLDSRLPAGTKLHRQVGDAVPIMRLPSTWDDQRSLFKRNLKESIRRSYNRFKRDGVRFEVTIHRDPAMADASLSSFFALHRLRSLVKGRREHVNHFREPKTQAFLTEVVPSLMQAGRLTMASLEVAGESIAVRISMQMHGSLYSYYSGFDPHWWRYSPATLLLVERIKAAINDGIEAVNFSPGIDNSKTRWGVTIVHLHRLTLARARPGPRLKLRLFHARKATTFAVRWVIDKTGRFLTAQN